MRRLGRILAFRTRWWQGVLAYAVVLVLIAGTVAGVGAIRQARATAAGCSEVKSAIETRGALPTVSTGTNRVLVVGDSWSAGEGLAATPKVAIARSWAATLGRARRWTVLDDAIAYTGYVNGGFCGGQQFDTRASVDLASHPDEVLIEGGINDTGATSSAISSAARTLLSRFASVRAVVLIGPGDAPARAVADRAKVVRALAAAARSAGRPFVDTSGWKLAYQRDGLHPTQAGQDAFAVQVSTALDRLN